MPRRMIMAMGVLMKERISQGKSEDEALNEISHAFLDRAAHIRQQEGRIDASVSKNFDEAMAAFGPLVALAWATTAFATVDLGHKLAASLMCTSVSQEVAADIPLPWPCFGITVPAGLMGDSQYCPTHLLLARIPDGSLRLMELGRGTMSMRAAASLAGFAEGKTMLTMSMPEGRRSEFDGYERVSGLLGRLLLGVCIEMDTPAGRAAVLSTPSALRMKRGEPKAWSYRLGRAVNLDVRDAVHAYATGERRGPMSVQVLVCGHPKRQAHGPGNTLRKWIHIEPHWRGPEEAPILVRAHELGKEA